MEPIQVYPTGEDGVWMPSKFPVMTDVLDGHHLIPGGCKITPPPALGPREAARALSAGADSGWEVVADWRGYSYYTADRVLHRIDEVGVVPPDERWEEPPPLTAAEEAQLRAYQIKQRLFEIDADGARPAREIAMALAAGGAPPAAAVSKILQLEEQAQQLRDELAALS